MVKTAKLKLSEFDNYYFESELVSESFCTPNDSIEIISLICCVKPITNDINYFVCMQPKPVIVKGFIFLEDAIDCYNGELEKLKCVMYE